MSIPRLTQGFGFWWDLCLARPELPYPLHREQQARCVHFWLWMALIVDGSDNNVDDLFLEVK